MVGGGGRVSSRSYGGNIYYTIRSVFERKTFSCVLDYMENTRFLQYAQVSTGNKYSD